MDETAVSDKAPAPPPARARPLILVVEQDPYVREIEAHFLLLAGYAVEFATDGKAALEQARALRPAVVVTEILVPKLDGLALCRQLKAEPQTSAIRVLVFSFLAANVRAREAGADAFLMKPLAEHSFLSTVENLLSLLPTSGPRSRDDHF